MKEFRNCSKCGEEITKDNLGDMIGAEENIVCDSCAEKNRLEIITELEKFRHSKEFEDKVPLRKKILETSERRGHLFDNATGTIRESVSDYDDYNVFELQSDLLNIELDCVNDNLAEGELGLPTKDNPKLQALRKDLINQIKRIASYLENE